MHHRQTNLHPQKAQRLTLLLALPLALPLLLPL